MRKYVKLIIIVFVVICWGITVSVADTIIVFAGGDSMGGRDEYTVEEINQLYEKGEWNNKVVFNSITDSVIGSEFDFVGAREDTSVNAGKDNRWNGRNIVAKDGKTYLVRMYVHNNGKSQEDWRETGVGVARDTHAFFSIPKGSSTSIDVRGFIDSSNASPSEYWDNVVFKSANGEQFYLEYIPGSAMIENNGCAAGGKSLSDDIVMKKEGTLIGYDKLDGNIPGCYQYDCYIGIKVKVVYDNCVISTTARKTGTKEWSDGLEVKQGDEIEYQIEYQNKSDTDQNNVMVSYDLPKGIEYVPGSTQVWNEGNDGNFVEDEIATERLNIGNYGPNANAYIRFRAIVTSDSLEILEDLGNKAQVVFDNDADLSDSDNLSAKDMKTGDNEDANSTWTLSAVIIGAVFIFIIVIICAALLRHLRNRGSY